MVIHKLIAFLRKDTFLSYFLNIKKPNQMVLEDKQITLLFYIYTIYFSNSFSLFFIWDTLSSDPFSGSHWFCISCTKLKEFLPFLGIEDAEFAHVTFGKKIKFTHVSNTPKSIRENFIQAIHSENNSSRYSTLNDLKALSYDKKNDFLVIHLNINSL